MTRTDIQSQSHGEECPESLPSQNVRVFSRKIHMNSDHHFNLKEHTVITIMSSLSFNQSWVRS